MQKFLIDSFVTKRSFDYSAAIIQKYWKASYLKHLWYSIISKKKNVVKNRRFNYRFYLSVILTGLLITHVLAYACRIFDKGLLKLSREHETHLCFFINFIAIKSGLFKAKLFQVRIFFMNRFPSLASWGVRGDLVT